MYYLFLQIEHVQIYGKLSAKTCAQLQTKKGLFFEKDSVILMTPEKLVNNEIVTSAIIDLMNRNMLHRLIIDECHCLMTYEH